MTAVEFHHVTKVYEIGERAGSLREALSRLGQGPRRRETVRPLDDVSFTVDGGETIGIIGRNGAGKSTMLKVLSRITVPTSGTSRTRGRLATLLEVGTGFHPELTGRENVFLNGAILGMSSADTARRLEAIVDFAGVERFLDTPVKRYSSGMYLRLAFSVAAHLEPDILVVDEILAVGDAAFQRRCLGRMDEAHAQGRTVVFVSHDLDALLRLCPRALWISEGRLVADGPARQVADAYLQSTLPPPGTPRTFTADPQGRLVVESVSVRSPGSATEGVTLRGEPIVLAVVFEVLEPVPGLDIAVTLDRRTTRVLSEGWSDTGAVPGFAKGRYATHVRIPPLLAVGEYTVGLWFGDAHEQVWAQDVVASLRVEGSDGGHGNRVLELRPPWDVQRLPEPA